MAAESKYQRKLKKQYEADGWLIIRLITATSTVAQTGIPDLLALKPISDGVCKVRFIEVKANKGKVSSIQEYHIAQLKKLGFDVEIDREKS